jgi:hypothetical protein
MSPDISAIADLAVRVVGLVTAIISLMTAVLNRRKKEPVQLPKEKKVKYSVTCFAKYLLLRSFENHKASVFDPHFSSAFEDFRPRFSTNAGLNSCRRPTLLRFRFLCPFSSLQLLIW